jgi:hypothetical protein
MFDRPRCTIDGCNNLGMRSHKLKSGELKYKNLCTTHIRKKYGMMESINKKDKEKKRQKYKTIKEFREQKKEIARKNGKGRIPSKYLEICRDFCIICGWNKTKCDAHRIIFGCNGGKYEKGNLISLCPNCHRLVHRGLLNIK